MRINCLDCKREVEVDRDIELCDDCVEKYDLDKLWQDHDQNLIDALDFNERASVREDYKR